MGKLIRCAGPIADRPYCFRMTKTNVYSIEEVCYYIRNHIYMMQEEVFDLDFAVWLREELGMEDTADKLESMRRDHNNLKDIVVTLCCSCDYFTESQINELIAIMDETQELPLRGRMKIRADSYYKAGNMEKARREYERILQSDDMLQAGIEEYGEIYHCLGVTCCHLGEFTEAAKAFCRAYEQNRKMESLQGYLYSLRLQGDGKVYKDAVRKMGLTEDQVSFFEAQYNNGLEQSHATRRYRSVKRLRLLAEEGSPEGMQRAEELLEQWKQEYRTL